MNNSHSEVLVNQWLAEPLPHDVRSALQRLQAADDVCRIAVMPDVHLAGDVCNGTVVATRELIYPQAVGGDIGCGMAAVALDGCATDLDDETIAGRLLEAVARRVPTNRHSAATMAAELPEPLRQTTLSQPRLDKLKSRDGRVQLGTLGRGNHFLEFQSDADDRLWLMLHTGSRAMGQEITQLHLDAAAKANSRSPSNRLVSLDAATPAGQDYLHDLAWALQYATENRLAILRNTELAVKDVLGMTVDWPTLIHGNHNHVAREEHAGRALWVHRKGALPAAEGEPGVIPGSMGTRSYHVRGRGCEESLCSSSHGAGRRLSRQLARRQVPIKQFLRDMRGVWFDERRAEALLEESPAAYRDIRRVMQAQRELTAVTRELTPVLCYKGT